MKKLVVLSGAGISAESGIKTFRDSDGLWENHRVEDVATPEAWQRNQKLVLDFYNERRKQALSVEPNTAHTILKNLEQFFDVTIITQNVDHLHELAGSRPHIVWFGEEVPMMTEAIRITEQADILVIIGTSLAVYPAAGLVYYVQKGTPIYLIDPAKPDITLTKNMTFIQEKATVGAKILYDTLVNELN